MHGDRSRSISRRRYLRTSGSIGALATAVLAGCLGGDGDENGNGNGDDDGAANESEDGQSEDDGSEDNESADNETEDGDGNGDVQGIVAGTAPGFPPFEMVEDGELVGFDVDLLEAVVGRAEGYELEEWSELEFDSLIPALEDGSIDVIAAAMTITEERQQSIAFTDPYFSADQSVLVAEDGDFQPESFEDFEGRTVGAQVGTTGEGVVESELIEPGIIAEADYSSYDNYVLAVEDLERGIVDAIVIDEPVGETFAGNRAVEVAFVHETGEEFGFGVRQDEDDLREALNDGLATVEEESEYEELVDEWFG